MANFHTAVVVVQRVGNGTIGQSSVSNRNFDAGAKHGRLRRAAEFAYVTRDSLADRLGNAGKRRAHTIQCRALGFLNYFAR